MAEKPKQYKYEPGTKEWEYAALVLASEFAPKIKECSKCRAPVADGYCCRYCGSDEP